MSETVRSGHPCFDKLAHFRVGRIHLPVAPRCNVKCAYCQRAVSRRINRPGVTTVILTPTQALARTKEIVSADPSIKVVGIAGPGDALANESTFETLSLVHKEFPEIKKCVSTNGLLLTDRLADLKSVGITSISVTVNAVDERVGRYFYDLVCFEDKVYREEAFSILSTRQLQGIEAAVKHGIAVKINTVLVPELNGEHLLEVAKTVVELGATLMNIMPLKPVGSMANYAPPNCLELEFIRAKCEVIIPQFRLCQQCRADAVGVPGKQKFSKLDAISWEETCLFAR